MLKPLTMWITTNCGKFLKELGVPDHLYVSQKAVEPGCGTTDWFTIGKGVQQSCILSPCLFKLYAEYITQNPGLGEAQAGIKITGRLSITSDMQMTPLMAESKEPEPLDESERGE